MRFEERLQQALKWVLPESKRPTVVAVDLDGTLARELEEYDQEKIGDPVHNAKIIMQKVKELGACIIINTCRKDRKIIKSWLEEHEIPYDHINKNPYQPNDTSSKLMADRYWDNKQPSWRGLQYAYEELKRLLSRQEQITESEELDPFEQWHREYSGAVKAARKDQPTWGSRSLSTNKQPTARPELELLNDPRARSIYVVEVMSINGYSSGVHAYGDQDDIPAGDPFDNANIETEIDSKTEQKLSGHTAFIVDTSGGSYHERWARMSVYVIVNDIVDNYEYEDLPESEQFDYQVLSQEDMKNIVKFFKFQSLEQVSEILEELEPSMSFPVEDGETREQYWKRVMASARPEQDPDPSGYDAGDNYYKSFAEDEYDDLDDILVDMMTRSD